MSDNTPNIQVGNKVLFVGGPEAGNVRVIPDSHGDMVQGANDYVYRIYPISLPGNKQRAFFAYAADQHPLQMFIDMWREYAPAAQIRSQTAGVAQTYQKVGGK
jgi:hypothetical protein